MAQVLGSVTVSSEPPEESELSDIEYMSIKEFDGKLVSAFGEVASNVTTEICSITVTDGKDFYLAGASIFVESGDSAGVTRVDVELQYDTTPVEHMGGWSFMDSGAGDEGGTGNLPFKNEATLKGMKLVGDGIKTVRLIPAVNDGAIIHGFIYGFEEDTGESPAN